MLLLDTLGELMDFYAAADVAFVGGSLVPVGGHNLLEPAALGLPVLSGPAAVQQPGHRARAEPSAARSRSCTMRLSWPRRWARLLADPQARAQQGAAGRAAIDANRGALERLLGLIERLPPPRHAA